ncbi:hypothetical protein K2173_025654 [Erythroxylum novogranatense]|uniref:TF-B3 domain-containing protein n=2 Tax=rosids TaxID=71275 RepID=A0AAV8SBN6_9ROSI|nr:hypothetical protein K2173_025654 [Erythroxylum novogranatense]
MWFIGSVAGICGLQVHAEDMHGDFGNEADPTTGFDAMVDEQTLANEDREIWLVREQDDLLDVNDASMFYDFPPLPDFPCMSSSSSSSSTPAPVKTMTGSSSSSSSASWAVLKSDADDDVEKRSHEYHNFAPRHHHHNYETPGQHDPVDATTAALSSTASMEVLQPPDQGMEGVDCTDMMENFGYMDLLQSNDLFPPSSLLQSDHENVLEEFQQEQLSQQNHQPQQRNGDWLIQSKSEQRDQTQQGDGVTGATDDLAMVFLEWLKSNKETVSAEDLRKVKIKKATIECAAKRLGGGREAMKQLLKLILEWVQTNHLQRRRTRESPSIQSCQYPEDPLHNPNPNPNSNPSPGLIPNVNCNSVQTDQLNPCFNPTPWIAPTPKTSYIADTSTVVQTGFTPVVGGYVDPFVNGAPNINGNLYPPPTDYPIIDSAQSWPNSQLALTSQYNSFPDSNNFQPAQPNPPAFTGFANQYPYQYVPGQSDQRLVRLGSSATKEARKKRMARQRRFLTHYRSQNNQTNHQNQQQGQVADQRLGNENGAPGGQTNPGSWAFWPTAGGGSGSTAPVLPVEQPPGGTVDRPAMQTQNYQRQVTSDRRQGWKPEKNLRFLLQKVLKQSDVGNLGRIVLPKKEAETHLPELEARDGISIAMEDIGTSRVWNMRYRFWPNNKSRMYLLENTGDFVRANGLQEGDFIVIYSDVKCGKYLIRGVKVRQPGPKSENKRSGKAQRNGHASSPSTANGSSATPIIQNQTQNHPTQAQTAK